MSMRSATQVTCEMKGAKASSTGREAFWHSLRISAAAREPIIVCFKLVSIWFVNGLVSIGGVPFRR